MSATDSIAPLKLVPLKVFENDTQVFRLRFTPCGTVLCGASMNARVKRWRLVEPPDPNPTDNPKAKTKKGDSGHQLLDLSPWEGFVGWVQAFAMHPSEGIAAAADSLGTVRCADLRPEKPQEKWSVPAAHDGWIRALAYSPDGARLFSVGRDGILKSWDSSTGKPLGECRLNEDLYAIAISPDGTSIAVSDAHARIHVINGATLTRSATFPVEEMFILARMQEVGGIRFLQFTRDGKHILAAGSKPATGGFVEASPRIIPVSVSDGALSESWKVSTGKDGFVLDIHPLPSGANLIAVSGQPGTGRVALFAPDKTEPAHTDTTPPNCQSIAVHPSGNYAITAATSRGGGNGKSLSPDGKYLPNTSPLHLFALTT
jgi:WD40 repeat protein